MTSNAYSPRGSKRSEETLLSQAEWLPQWHVSTDTSSSDQNELKKAVSAHTQ